ncbi:MAG: hypothetical protein ACRC8S_01205 [Fimbriiglobus sp.]
MNRRWLGLCLFLPCSLVLLAAEPVTVFMPDGYMVQGQYARETETITDGSGRPVRVPKADGLDIIQDGPKYVFFSTHAGRGGKIDKETQINRGPEYKTKLKNKFNRPVAPWAKITKETEFNAEWIRTLEMITFENQFQSIKQQITKLDPYSFVLESPSDNINQAYHTCEESPEKVRKWLSLHPDLREATGKVDGEKRLKIAEFLRDVTKYDATRRQVLWIQATRAELEKLKKDLPEPWDAKVSEAYRNLNDDVERLEARYVIDELEAALKCGRYDTARKFLSNYQPKLSDAKETTRLATVKAAIEAVQPQYERTLELLRVTLERESGMLAIQTNAAIIGVGPAIFTPRPNINPTMTKLLNAGAQILEELHPDTASRLELFHDLAKQAEARRSQGKEANEKAENLIAYAITGWLKGKNGADQSVEVALQCWDTRNMAKQYLRKTTGNDRKILLDDYAKANPKQLNPEELTQIISLMPPPFAADLSKPVGKPIPAAEALGVDGLMRLNTGPTAEFNQGVNYVLKLPPEYHHGRSYPVVLALHSKIMSPEFVAANLAEQAEKNGYILIAPDWTNSFSNGLYEFTGKEHTTPLAVLRDVLLKFQVDADKVFLFGYAEGANFAMDLAAARPDHFAGVAGIGMNPPPALFVEYWRNCQKLPMYMISGEFTGAFNNLRKVMDKWMPRGFPAMLTLYRGRGVEWYPAEIPRLFDWMNRKTRVRGSATLRLSQFSVEPWQVLRETDSRYYWVGVAPGGMRGSNPVANGIPPRMSTIPQFAADIGKAGVINITQSIGIRKYTVWLEKDLIDWSKPLRITINGSSPISYTAKILKPDLQLMLEEIHRTGDRKMMFLGKVDVDGPG